MCRVLAPDSVSCLSLDQRSSGAALAWPHNWEAMSGCWAPRDQQSQKGVPGNTVP